VLESGATSPAWKLESSLVLIDVKALELVRVERLEACWGCPLLSEE
jgi:hypothetical protein